MPLADKLEAIFNIETETSIESTIMEFVKAGENYQQKTIIPLPKPILSISFAKELADDIDEEFRDVIHVLNYTKNIPLTITKNSKEMQNPEMITFASSLPNVLLDAMKLAPSFEGKSRKELQDAIAAVRATAVNVKSGDTVDKVMRLIRQ